MTDTPYIALPGTVAKVIAPAIASVPEKIQIQLEVEDPLYRDLRIENTLKDATGKRVHLKPGVEVQITVEATPDATPGSHERTA
jgi:hypothetical protein